MTIVSVDGRVCLTPPPPLLTYCLSDEAAQVTHLLTAPRTLSALTDALMTLPLPTRYGLCRETAGELAEAICAGEAVAWSAGGCWELSVVDG